jgi:heme-degrading monooxygenase HmoA
VYASLTVTTGSNENMAELAVLAGEAMVTWLREIEGFEGLLMLSNSDTGTTHVISLWESREVAERHRESRMRLRDSVTATVDVHVEETVNFDVLFAYFTR